MKKKVIALILGSALAAASLTGCSGDNNSTADTSSMQTTTTEEGSETTNESAAGSDDIVEIFWQYPAISDVGEGFYRMEDALNEMMERDIGVHVTFVPTGLMESQQNAILSVSTGEQLDICLSAFTSVAKLVENGLVQPLDDIIEEYGPDILEVCGAAVGGCYYDGKLYGVPTSSTAMYTSYGYKMKKVYFDKYGFENDRDKLYTFDEIEEMFSVVKAGEGDNFYMFTPWNNTVEPLNSSYLEFDKPSGDLTAGVVMLNRSFDELTVYNLFETPEYEEFCKRMYDWRQKGYIAPDASVDTDYSSRAANDNYMGNFSGIGGAIAENPSDWNQDIVVYRTIAPYIAQNGGRNMTWNIPVTSVNPAKALEAINYLFKNKEATWLILYGFEGEEYEVVEDNGVDKIIRYLADNPQDLPYYQPYGIYGDRFAWPVFYPNSIDFNRKIGDYHDQIPESKYSPIIGYSFNQSSVTVEMAAVQTVIEQYYTTFNSGVLDPDKALPEFQSALKAAGIDKVIAENQRQLDEWAASKK